MTDHAVLTAASTTPQGSQAFKFPHIHTSAPYFYTLQPTPSTLQSQLKRWSSIIQRYCQHNRLFSLTLIDISATPLFTNKTLHKRLFPEDIVRVIEFMVSIEGGQRAEWKDKAKSSAWIYWKRPEEWAGVIAKWVEETGQRGTVLTVFEILEGEGTMREEFHGMDAEVLRKGLGVLVKMGKAQIFGERGEEGVKFF